MPDNFKIREVNIADFDSIFLLLEQLWMGKSLDKTAMQQMFNANLNAGHQHYVCAVADDAVIGFCSLTVKNNLWQQGFLGNVEELVVDKTHRRSGVGRALLHHITAHAKAIGCKRIELDSSFHRKEAHQFYEDLGFEKRAFLFSKAL